METSYDTPTGIHSTIGQPTWEIAHLFPSQGEWTEDASAWKQEFQLD